MLGIDFVERQKKFWISDIKGKDICKVIFMEDSKKLVVIGANDFQNQLILKAKEKGYETHVFAWECGDIGEKNADYFYPISIVEKEEIYEKCKEIRPCGVVSIASDLANITVNYIAEKLGLRCNGIEATELSTNKHIMRDVFEKNNLPSPKSKLVENIEEYMDIHMSLPLIVKPTDRSGSRGIFKIDNYEQLKPAIEVAMAESFEKKVLVEEFAEGDEYSVEYISYNGKHYFLNTTKKYTTGAPNFIETGHMEPSGLSEEMVNKVKEVVEKSLDALKVKYGASHSELKIDNSGNIRIIEIGSRMGGDCIGSDLVMLSTGFDFVSNVIDVACGKEPDFTKVKDEEFAAIRFIFNQDDIDRLELLKQKYSERLYRISEIEEVSTREVKDSSTRFGYYLFTASTSEELYKMFNADTNQ